MKRSFAAAVVLLIALVGAARAAEGELETDPGIDAAVTKLLAAIEKNRNAPPPPFDNDLNRTAIRAAVEEVKKLDGTKAAISALVELLRKEGEFAYPIPESVQETLGQFGADAVPPLLKELENAENSSLMRRRTLEALGEVGAEAKGAAAALIKILSDRGGEGGERAAAVAALGRMEVPAEQVLEYRFALLVAYQTTSRPLEAQAWEQLAKLSREELFETLTAALQGPDPALIAGADWALGGFDLIDAEDPKGYVQSLVGSLKDADAKTRLEAVTALGNLGPGARPATAAVKEATKDTDKDVAAAARRALRKVQ